MNLRQQQEEWERKLLSDRAVLSSETRGREKEEQLCQVRMEFHRDRDRIIHSKSFRRLKHKTQVFLTPEGDHFRTRLTHTLEVSQIARTVARALRLNEDLTEAIALGHDLGHTPFGHSGEELLDELIPGGFRHNEQSLRVVDRLGKGEGLNLTWEVRDGIRHHTGPELPATLEGQIVRIADRLAYINHDIDDAYRGGLITKEDLPEDCIKILGENHRERINTMVIDMIECSRNAAIICMGEEVKNATDKLRQFLFKKVYIGSKAKTEEIKAKRMLKELFAYYLEHTDELPSGSPLDSDTRRAADYIAGMTDNYATNLYLKLFVPRGFKG